MAEEYPSKEEVLSKIFDAVYAQYPKKQWQGLSDDEILKLYNECHIYDYKMGLCFARAIEQALKEKNHGS